MSSLPDDWIIQELIQRPGRDAWAAIRGFLYQVRSTILRWLDLDQQTLLLCEYGEDIAHLRRVVDPTTKAELHEHLLEQIKHSEKHVTLRTLQVLEALANFYQAKVANPTLRLRLRYTTNATPGQEQGVNFPQGLSGIEACRRIRTNDVSKDEVDRTIVAFRTVIESTATPAGSTEKVETFEALKRFATEASREEIFAFLGDIEWATGQPEHENMPKEIENRLVGSGLASPKTTKRISDRLTIFVVDLLSRSGAKLLSRDNLLQVVNELEMTEPQIHTLVLLERLDELVQLYLPEIASGVTRVEEAIRGLAQPVEQTHELVKLIASRLVAQSPGDQIVRVEDGVPPIDLPPAPPRFEADRSELVGELATLLRGGVWLHLHGGAGMGKTHLARRLMLRAGTGNSAWISFTSSTARTAPLQYLDDRIVALLVSRTGDTTWWVAYRTGRVSAPALMPRVARLLGPGGLLVLDDLPDLVSFPELADRVSNGALACQASNAMLLTTSQRPLTPGAKKGLEPRLMVEALAPPIEIQDTLAMLQAAGAPTQLQAKGFVEILTHSAKGHPAIISGVIRWLEQQAWAADWDSIIAILTGAAAAEEKETALRQMVQLVPLPEQRELLCRLSLIGRQFGRREVEIVAHVYPALDRPGEPLGELVGPWVNRYSNESYEVSPLVNDAGRRYLATDLQKRIHRALAGEILQKGKITTTESTYVAVHLSSAEDWQEVATFLIQMLISVRTPEHAQNVDWATFLFPPGNWPDSIPLAFRLMLRGLQVKVARLSGDRMVEQLESELDQLLLATGGRPDEQLAAVMALLNAGPLLESAPPARAARRALEAVRLIRNNPKMFEGVEVKVHIVDLLWLPVSRVMNLADVRGIATVLDDMSTEELEGAFRSNIALQACEFLADRCWLSMDAVPKEKQDWNAVLQVLEQLENLAQRRRLENLRYMALQARAVVLSDYLGQEEAGLQLLRDAGEPTNQDCLFFVRYRIARILDDLSRTNEAIDGYERALASGGRDFVYLRFRAYIEGIVACGRACDWERALLWARRGLAFASTHPKTSFREFQVH